MSILDLYKITYAQNREDIIIDAFFRDVDKGFYVDIGANDPIDDSVTYLFYKKGWNGINIEPNSALYKKLCLHRPNDKNLQVGVSESKGELVLRQYINHGLSTFADVVKSDYLKEHSEKTDEYEDVKVEVDSLDSILLKNAKNKHIHFMKIDVEGYEFEVIKSSDWKIFRPELLCIESNHIVKDWRPMLKDANYSLVFNDGLNDYYLADESLYRVENFDYAKFVLLDGQPISPGVEYLIKSGEENQVQLLETKSQLQTQREQNDSILKQRNELFAELDRYQGFRRQTKMLLVATYAKLLRKAEGIAYITQHSSPTQSVRNSSSYKGLLTEIKRYDAAVLSEKRLVGSAWRRTFSRFFVIILKIPKFIVRNIIRTLKKITEGKK